MDVRYRLRQAWRNVTAGSLSAGAIDEIRALLSLQEMALFGRFCASDQAHSYRVMRTLRDAGETEPDLLKAALLHDIGKSEADLSVVDRTLIVIGEHFRPEQAAAWGAGPAEGWRAPFVVRARHAEWGARLAAGAGSNPRVVSLIRRHQDKGPLDPSNDEDALLARLQWADDQN